jgi:cytoskeletal protein RodZ
MDEETEVAEIPSVGDRLRAAREEKGLSLEQIAEQTRIPRRHLESLEAGDWERLPAPTYTVGFAKNYAGVVGLDRAEIGEQLREEMGGYRSDTATIEHFEPADPARTMPKWLVLSAIGAIIVVVLIFSWVRNRSLTEAQPPAPAAAQQAAQQPTSAVPAPAQQPAQQAAAAQAPVVITATAPAWIRVTDQGRTLFEGMMQPGQSYPVPQTAVAPLLRAGAPEAIRINVGNAVAPSVGPAGKVASNVSLKPADLMRGPAAAAQQPAPQKPAAQPAPAPVQNTAGQ